MSAPPPSMRGDGEAPQDTQRSSTAAIKSLSEHVGVALVPQATAMPVLTATSMPRTHHALLLEAKKTSAALVGTIQRSSPPLPSPYGVIRTSAQMARTTTTTTIPSTLLHSGNSAPSKRKVEAAGLVTQRPSLRPEQVAVYDDEGRLLEADTAQLLNMRVHINNAFGRLYYRNDRRNLQCFPVSNSLTPQCWCGFACGWLSLSLCLSFSLQARECHSFIHAFVPSTAVVFVGSCPLLLCSAFVQVIPLRRGRGLE
jgi:hypothetical protein